MVGDQHLPFRLAQLLDKLIAGQPILIAGEVFSRRVGKQSKLQAGSRWHGPPPEALVQVGNGDSQALEQGHAEVSGKQDIVVATGMEPGKPAGGQ